MCKDDGAGVGVVGGGGRSGGSELRICIMFTGIGTPLFFAFWEVNTIVWQNFTSCILIIHGQKL